MRNDRRGTRKGSEYPAGPSDMGDLGGIPPAGGCPHASGSACGRPMSGAGHTPGSIPPHLGRIPHTGSPEAWDLPDPAVGASDGRLRCAYRFRPVGVAGFSTMRYVAGCLPASPSADRLPSRLGATYPSMPRASGSAGSRPPQYPASVGTVPSCALQHCRNPSGLVPVTARSGSVRLLRAFPSGFAPARIVRLALLRLQIPLRRAGRRRPVPTALPITNPIVA